jgi:hypothetical protein
LRRLFSFNTGPSLNQANRRMFLKNRNAIYGGLLMEFAVIDQAFIKTITANFLTHKMPNPYLQTYRSIGDSPIENIL